MIQRSRHAGRNTRGQLLSRGWRGCDAGVPCPKAGRTPARSTAGRTGKPAQPTGSTPASISMEHDLFRPAFARRSAKRNDGALPRASRRRETGVHFSGSCSGSQKMRTARPPVPRTRRSHPNCRESNCDLRVQSGTRIKELLVSFDSEVRIGACGKLGRTSESGH